MSILRVLRLCIQPAPGILCESAGCRCISSDPLVILWTISCSRSDRVVDVAGLGRGGSSGCLDRLRPFLGSRASDENGPKADGVNVHGMPRFLHPAQGFLVSH